MDLGDILNNETVRGLIKQAGVSDGQIDSVMNQAVGAINKKFKENPGQVSSLISDNPNTDDDESMASSVQNDFLSGLIQKVGLPDNIAQSVSAYMPQIIQQFSSGLSSKGANSQDGIAGLLGNFVDMFDGDSNNGASGKSGGMGFLSKLLGSFFGKK
ncbi:MAG: hypothetical protein EP338_07105 [Bacteroidetes bacterium]|nr:MAG: hypothetical protein EP338_07105 [Bacteroidota bacterium]